MVNAKQIYLISGLGTDERMFQHLDLKPHHIHHIHWIKASKHEPLEDYCKRLLPQIKSENPVLIGLSFGGMVAQEIAKLIQTEKVIILSSFKSKKEIPFYFRWMFFFKIHKIFPFSLIKKANKLTYWLFGSKNKKDKNLLKKVLLETDISYLKWAIHSIAEWQNKNPIKSLYHIHGSKDNLLPLQSPSSYIVIKDGGHLMVLNKAPEISKIILDCINKTE